MKKTLFIHIGQTKTGSTSIQRFLHVNRAQLALRGVFYPAHADPGEAESRHHHRYLVHALQQARPHLRSAAAPWRDLVVSIERQAAPVAVISCELFWHLFAERPALRARALQWMAEMLGAFDVRVICYLRRQDGWVEAMYNQLVKSGQTPAATQGFDAFLQRHREGPHLDYARMLRPWVEAFGAGAVIVRSFERERLHEGDVVADFAHLLGVHDLGALKRPADAQQRLSWPVCELLTVFNELPELNELRGEFIRLVTACTEAAAASRLLAPADAAALHGACAAGNSAVAAAHCDGVPLFAPPAAGENATTPYQPLSQRDTALALVRVFAAQQRELQALRPAEGLRAPA